jgi:hypothetical protein
MLLGCSLVQNVVGLFFGTECCWFVLWYRMMLFCFCIKRYYKKSTTNSRQSDEFTFCTPLIFFSPKRAVK